MGRDLSGRFDANIEQSPGTGTSRIASPRPAIVLGLVFLGLAILMWPAVLDKFVSLDWRLGNMRPLAYGIAAVSGVLALVTVLARQQINFKFFEISLSRRRAFFAAATLSFSLALTLAVSEGLLRLLHLPFQSKWPVSEDALARFDRELGWSYIPNRSATQEFGQERRKVTMYFDDLGLRVAGTRDHADPASPSVLFVGDSFTFGHGVTYEESFIGQLRSRPDFPFQVINLGVQGYGTDQALLLLKRQFQKFKVEAVVYCFISLQVDRNEIYDVRILHPGSRFLGTKPMFALKQDGGLFLAKAPQRYEDLSYSRLWACLEILKQRWGPKPTTRLTRALIKEMKTYVESRAAKFVVIDWNQWSSGQSKAAWREGEFPWGLDLDVIRPGASAPPGWSTWIIRGDGHPDPRAHLFVSELVASELKRITGTDGRIAVPSRQQLQK